MNGFSLERCELGVATAATQIEGGHARTNWHRWAEEGHIIDGSTPARANDHWNRVDQDIALLGELNVKHYRMGLEWARIEPEPGVFDPEAIAHYRDEITKLRAVGITPLVTLHHFNNPIWLEDLGGFLYDNVVEVFLRYVRHVVTTLGDLVDEWITINEPNIYATHAYFFGEWPPGQKSLPTTMRVYQVLAVAHIKAYELIHRLQPSAKVGVAQHLRIFVPQWRFNPRHITTALVVTWLFQGAIGKAMSRGRFRYPLVQPRGIKFGRYYDFQGINYYSRSTVAHFKDTYADGVDINDLGWEIYPQGLMTLAEQVHRDYPDAPIYITENGTADAEDNFRSRFLYDQLKLIAASDLPITRYYHWSFIDNWEWIAGEWARFGLIHNDYDTQTRTIRPSGHFYADIGAHGGVTEEAYEKYVAHQTYGRTKRVFGGSSAGGGFWG